jgi:hypothetical protein
MSNKSKNKGKSWERDVCNFLSDLYSQSFIRVPNSGAFVGGKNEFRKETLSLEQIKLMRGDIVPPLNYPYFVAECKNYADFPFHQMVHNNSIRLLDEWIGQVMHDCNQEKDVWMLFIKITRKGQYVVYDTRILDALEYGIRYKNYWFCDMRYFFDCYKDRIEMKWKGE